MNSDKNDIITETAYKERQANGFVNRSRIVFRALFPFWKQKCRHCGHRFSLFDDMSHDHTITGTRYAICRKCLYLNVSVFGISDLFLMKNNADDNDFVKAQKWHGSAENTRHIWDLVIFLLLAAAMISLKLMFPDKINSLLVCFKDWTSGYGK